ncbi:STAS/SEC14 domain-containing protein [Congregibacter sp.]|uniref:STAS/SEC14 domain-containing protein n=1 Tax=Congregibacter sp. TaxID=2744308 RepID=UPI00385EC793
MLTVDFDDRAGVLVLEPQGELSKSDFTEAAKAVDPYLERNANLCGLIIHVDSFPGWDSFASLIAHLKFVRDHHARVSRVAFATNSPIGSVAEKVASHFIKAEIKSFDFDQFDAARDWLLDE